MSRVALRYSRPLMYSHLAFSIDSSSGSFTKPAKHSTRLVIGSKASMSFEWSLGQLLGIVWCMLMMGCWEPSVHRIGTVVSHLLGVAWQIIRSQHRGLWIQQRRIWSCLDLSDRVGILRHELLVEGCLLGRALFLAWLLVVAVSWGGVFPRRLDHLHVDAVW